MYELMSKNILFSIARGLWKYNNNNNNEKMCNLILRDTKSSLKRISIFLEHFDVFHFQRKNKWKSFRKWKETHFIFTYSLFSFWFSFWFYTKNRGREKIIIEKFMSNEFYLFYFNSNISVFSVMIIFMLINWSNQYFCSFFLKKTYFFCHSTQYNTKKLIQ